MNDDVEQSLSKFEQELCKSLVRIEIRGKKGKKLPVLLALEMKNSLDYLNSVKNEARVSRSNQYVFAVNIDNSESNIRSSDCLRKFSVECGAKNPGSLTSTKFRKHSQNFSATKFETERIRRVGWIFGA